MSLLPFPPHPNLTGRWTIIDDTNDSFPNMLTEEHKNNIMFKDFMCHYKLVDDCIQSIKLGKGLLLKNESRRFVFRFLPLTRKAREPVGEYYRKFMCSNIYTWEFEYEWAEQSMKVVKMNLGLSDIHIKTLTQHELIFECNIDSYSFSG